MCYCFPYVDGNNSKQDNPKCSSVELVTSKITLQQRWCLFCKCRAVTEDMKSEQQTLLSMPVYMQSEEISWRIAF